MDVDDAIASSEAAQVLNEEGNGEEEEVPQKGIENPNTLKESETDRYREPAQMQQRRQQQPSMSGQRMLAAKSVTFNPSDQTPLMFSRASSYDSLNSFDQVCISDHFLISVLTVSSFMGPIKTCYLTIDLDVARE